MKDKLLLIINQIRLNNNLNVLNVISETDDLRGDIGFNSLAVGSCNLYHLHKLSDPKTVSEAH